MLAVHVHVSVREECIQAFQEATQENARNSINEPGVFRFDCLQENDDPSKFILIEVYRTEEAPAAHKETVHYQTWRDSVADMMAEPRRAVKYTDIYPLYE